MTKAISFDCPFSYLFQSREWLSQKKVDGEVVCIPGEFQRHFGAGLCRQVALFSFRQAFPPRRTYHVDHPPGRECDPR